MFEKSVNCVTLGQNPDSLAALGPKVTQTPIVNSISNVASNTKKIEIKEKMLGYGSKEVLDKDVKSLQSIM